MIKSFKKGLIKRIISLIECKENSKDLGTHKKFIDNIAYNKGENAYDNYRSK
ncbi:hypothetical protein [Clostridium saccharobutylicum]|uniref:Uncharacterized protein n=1 Tax=Clostridium saccharobutylicum TaxID=169679 RepID=A0A1S8NCR8_CLOSA|nr:hypothetical protein [Clostridium saccharobutylicum]OOM14294.1 hypothetical protein CLOSAC_11670 [Clostridium saccharobutylicum]